MKLSCKKKKKGKILNIEDNRKNGRKKEVQEYSRNVFPVARINPLRSE